MKYSKYGREIEEYSPNITAVIPAYNAEKFLPRCMNSLIFQLDVAMEIIVVVDEGTTDDSVKIVCRYADSFPGKVFCIVKEGRGLSPARKFGMEHAKAPYVLFVDVDDYVDQRLGSVCFQLAMKKDADIVGYNFAEYTTYKNRLRDYKAATSLKTQSISEAIEDGGIGWWKFLFSVGFLKENAVFVDMLWEDAGEIPALLSKAKNYAYTSEVLYYKINNEESMTETFPKISRRFVEHTLANTMTLENVAPEFYASACYRTGKRMIFPFFKFYSYYDHLVEYMKEHRWIYSFENDVWKRMTQFERNYVTNILALPDPGIPLRIFMDGFTETDREKYRQEAEKGFWNWEEIIVLDETNCDVNENPLIAAAYQNGRTEIAAEYFALKKIYEMGGIYIGSRLRLNSTLNSMRFKSNFFGFETESTITSELFGAKSEDEVIKDILRTFQDGKYYEANDSTGEHIRTVLVGKCGIKMTGREQHGLYGTAVYPAMVFVINANGQCNNISYVEAKGQEDILTISRKVFEHCISYQMENAEFLKAEISKYQKQLKDVKQKAAVNTPGIGNKAETAVAGQENDIKQLNQTIRDREQEIRDLKNSFTFRFGYFVTYIPRRIYRFVFRKKYR